MVASGFQVQSIILYTDYSLCEEHVVDDSSIDEPDAQIREKYKKTEYIYGNH